MRFVIEKTSRCKRGITRRYRFVRVRLPFENGEGHVLDVTAKLPASVEVVAIVAVMVPPSWPTHHAAATGCRQGRRKSCRGASTR